MARNPISVTEAVGPAIQDVKRILFSPFDLARWMTIGFCAWLACLGESGAHLQSGYRFDRPGHVQMDRAFNEARAWVVDNLSWLVPVVITVVIVLLAIGVAILWVNSRGKFMFLHCVALNRAEVVVPWNRYATEGNSLFVFRFVLGLISLVTFIPFIVLLIISIIPLVHDSGSAGAIIVLCLSLFGLIVLAVIWAVIYKMISDFLVPLMYLRESTASTALTELMQLIKANLGAFAVYLLFQLLLSIAIGIALIALILVTCCIAGCIMAIPYIGTVLLLPILVFRLAYTLRFLAQFGPDYDVFSRPNLSTAA